MKRLLSIYLLLVSFLTHGQKVHYLDENDYVQEYQVAGPFQEAGITPDSWQKLFNVSFMNEEEGSFNDEFINVKAKNNRIDFNKILGDSSLAVAYAGFTLESKRNENALLLVSAENGARVYVNGKEIHTHFGGGWTYVEAVEILLNEGKNNVMIKVPNRDWGWSLSLKALNREGASEYLENKEKEKKLTAFFHSDLVPQAGNDLGYTFYPGRFPDLNFENPLLVKKYLGGDYKISITWFDRDLNEVNCPMEPGKYAYYAIAEGSNGRVLKKSATLFCAPAGWMGWNERLNADLEYFPVNGAPREVWEKHSKAINQLAGFTVFKSIMKQKEGALIQAFVDDVNREQLSPDNVTTPLIRNGDFHARLKQKILNVENKYSVLQPPKIIEKPVPELKYLSDMEAEEFQKMKAELTIAGNFWMDDNGNPFDMVIAKNGKILFHESFGKDLYGEFTMETESEVASITKLLSGMLFAQFVDQGIIGIDDPVGKYLPDFPLKGPNAITLRHCFTHTAGFDNMAHGIYGGVYNPWLESTLLLTLEGDTAGNQLQYNGMGYDLAGKVMEVVSGKSIFRLLREYLYDPLEMDNTEHDWDLGYSVHSTAYDLAKVAQLLLNKGSYGNLQFFGEETYEKIIPLELNQFYPAIDQKWGIGITGMDWKIKDEETGEDRFLVSQGIIGHGSATASVFWVIPSLDMIITQSRRRGGENYAPNFINMMKVVEKYLVD